MKAVRMILASTASLLAGGLIGAGVALLYAPQSGRATRRMIYSKGMAIKERALEEVNLNRARAMGKLNKASRNIQNQATHLTSQLQDLVEDQQTAIKEVVSSMPLPFQHNGH
jgi:gas vesicle protein